MPKRPSVNRGAALPCPMGLRPVPWKRNMLPTVGTFRRSNSS